MLNVKNALIATLLQLTAYALTAQIEEGAASIGGNIDVGYKMLNSPTNRKSESIQENARIKAGVFLSDRFMLEGNLGLNATQSLSYNFKNAELSGGLAGRYYFSKDKNLKWFAGAGAMINTGGSFFDTDRNPISSSNKINGFVFVGNDYFLTKNIALETVLSYGSTDNNSQQLGINISLRNFVGKKSTEDAPENAQNFIAKGRVMADASLSFNHIFNSNAKGAGVSASVSYAQFLTKGLLIGGSASLKNVSNGFSDRRFQGVAGFESNTLNAEIMGRYYVPLTKRLFVYPEAKMGYYQSNAKIEPNTTYSSKGFYGSMGIGASYFLNRNMALDANVVRFSKSDDNTTSTSAGINLGIRYFFK